MTMTSIRVRRGALVTLGAMTASAALVLGGLTSASAADTQLGPDDIAGFESEANYNSWHIGSVTNQEASVEDSLTFDECSVTILAPPANSGSTASDTQVFQGLFDGQSDSLEDLAAIFDTLSVALQGGNDVTLQIALSVTDDDSDDFSGFTTVRNANSFNAEGTFTLDGQALTSSRPAFGQYGSPEELLTALGGRFGSEDPVTIFGVGIVGEPGAVAESISFLGDTFYFGTGDCLPEQTGDGDDDSDDDDDDGPVEDDDVADAPQAPTRPTAVDTGR